MPMISIIVPIYKVEPYLRRCVDSILAQTFRDYELFLVDDGSPDRCGEICDEFARRDDRIIVIHKENGGLSDARNAALERFSGEYVTFIDSDDYVAPEHLESLYNALIETDSDISIAGITSFSEKDRNDDFYRPATERQILEGADMFRTMDRPCAPVKLYKRFIYEHQRFPVGRLYEDAFIYHDVLARAKRVCLTGQNTYFYFIRGDSIMHQSYRLAFTDIIDAIELRIAKLEELGLQELANENRPFIYSRVGAAFANLDASVPENKRRLDEVKAIYDAEYPKLMRETNNIKQKIRYWLLKINPDLHTKLFGRKISLALG